jgi:uncharacterized protein YndB with AHSA1/START domain
MAAPAGKTAAKEVLITRVFNAPRDLVFRAWSESESLKRWYAPQGCSITACTVDFRPGGRFLTCIRTPDGMDCWCAGVYREIVRPERIVCSMHMADEGGNFVEPAKSHLAQYPDWPREMVLTLTFEDLGAKTKLTLHQTVSEELAKRTGAYPSWLSMFDRLDRELAGH